MKRKCLVLFILTIFICTYSQFFSGCAKKVAVESGNVAQPMESKSSTIAKHSASEIDAKAKAQANAYARRDAEEKARMEMSSARAEQMARAAEESEEFTLNEITVTAEKREAELQKIPMDIAVVRPEEMERLSVHQVEDLAKLLPDLKITRSQGGKLIIQRRDVGGNTEDRGDVTTKYDNPTQETTVAVHIDGVQLTEKKMSGLLGSEVLKGPQGTLYGRGSISDSINMVSKRPDIVNFGRNLKITTQKPATIHVDGTADIILENAGIGTEIWVIEKTSSAIGKEYRTESPRLIYSLPGKEDVILPLESTSVDANISGYIATVNVLQKYHNPYRDKIEAVYVFPLPQNAAVTDFVMIVGDRKIRGLIREKEEAKRIYQQAKSQGYRASLLTQERPNIFKQSVANIEPGKRIDISITFFNPLKYENGEFVFVFPTVVGPRFNPPGQRDGIGALGKSIHNGSGQSTDVHYLKPNESSAHNIDIKVDIDAGVSIEKVYSNSHVINVSKDKKTPARATVILSPNDRIPNKDFVLGYKTSGSGVKTAMMVHKGDKGNYFSLLIQPPEDLKHLPRIPRELVFVLDCSGSMNGKPIAKAKEAVRRAIRNLDENDTFQIIRFSSNASSLGWKPISATPENVKKGLRYLDSLRSGGGTMMIEGIRAALDFPHDNNRLRIVSFMTDGYIGNEPEILAAIHEKLGESRIFSFGVGSSVNRYLLERMAVMGRGAVAYVGLDESAGEAVDRFYDVATRPALANIKIDWGGLKVTDIYPKQIPDLFVGRPIMITGRLKNTDSSRIRIKGQVGNEKSYFNVPVNPENSDAEHPGIQSVWARFKLAELSNRETYNPGNGIKNEIIKTSINYNLISRYTAFLAVDGLERTKGGHGYTVDVPVPVPDGVKYETTVN